MSTFPRVGFRGPKCHVQSKGTIKPATYDRVRVKYKMEDTQSNIERHSDLDRGGI